MYVAVTMIYEEFSDKLSYGKFRKRMIYLR